MFCSYEFWGDGDYIVYGEHCGEGILPSLSYWLIPGTQIGDF